MFALLDSDGKLKIWDVKESRLAREYVPKLHLSAPQTCFVWFESCAKKVSDVDYLLIVLVVQFHVSDRVEITNTIQTQRYT